MNECMGAIGFGTCVEAGAGSSGVVEGNCASDCDTDREAVPVSDGMGGAQLLFSKLLRLQTSGAKKNVNTMNISSRETSLTIFISKPGTEKRNNSSLPCFEVTLGETESRLVLDSSYSKLKSLDIGYWKLDSSLT